MHDKNSGRGLTPGARRMGAVAAALWCLPGLPLAQASAAGQPGDISGIWLASRSPGAPAGSSPSGVPIGGALRTLEGDPVPLQPWAAEIYDKRQKDDAAGTPFAGTMAQCLPHGMPGMAVNEPYPIQIIQSPGQVTILHELMHSYRIIPLDQKLPEDPDPSFMGASVGHWEGDTLVVTTIGIRDNTSIGGIPHSDELRTVERIRRTGPDTLEVILTLEDPKTFTKPWRMRGFNRLQAPGSKLIEYICENQHYTVDEEGRSRLDKSRRPGGGAN